jgi:periplasmic protein TonB
MFDLIEGREKHLPSHATLPILLSTVAQGTLIAIVALLPLLYVTDRLPEVPTMMAFVAALPAPPPPPPPPVAIKAKPEQPKAASAATENQFIAPLEEPARISQLPDDEYSWEGVPGGVEGGLAEGVVGGIVGGLPEPPAPPPPAPVHKAPVRIGGQIRPPQLLKRVEPEYPQLAVAAQVQGVVILEATVSEEGMVTDVRILRSVHPLLDREADRVVRQWRYSPVVLNDIPVPFILTVTLSFALEAPR